METTRGAAPAASASPLHPERLVFERLMASGAFERSPNLALILNYVCRKYFEERVVEIKEYNIAVEALGRAPEFDKKKDAIVRVEVHRLRKRLQQYFSGPGQGELYEIIIPEGTYVPEFRPRPTAVDDEAASSAPAAATPALHPARKAALKRSIVVVMA